ncbi:Mariner Mos1 transposase [Araneus ventricosus]|uniref:Mariner Mos1 transposase n=1 Tax=Araneus ventricosus TaxID=182803 RepID=A0A4Y2RU99_ARAVE|nr:Mariner Mos1 transposase [Araneus ventricosus]
MKFNRWLPLELTAEDERKREAACLALLRDQRKRKILDRIVTRDEKWVYYNKTSRKGGCSAPGESAGTVARRALTRRCCSVSGGIVAELSAKKSGQTINSAIYSNMLIKVRDAIRGKRRNEFRIKVVRFNKDNARPHINTMTGWTLCKLKWDLMQHPPYSPDMALSDFYPFSHLQLHHDGGIFNSNEVINVEMRVRLGGMKTKRKRLCVKHYLLKHNYIKEKLRWRES